SGGRRAPRQKILGNIMNSSCAEALQIWGLDGDIVVFKDGSLGTGFRLQPVDPATWTDSECNAFSEKLRTFVCGLPEGLRCQFVLRVEKATDSRVREFERLVS